LSSACAIGSAEAQDFPASEYATPWSGEVRGSGKPSVTFTVRSKSSAFEATNPWS